MLYKTAELPDVDHTVAVLQDHYKKFLTCTTSWSEPFLKSSLDQLLPDLANEFLRRGWVFDVARVFVTAPHSAIPIHLDGNPEHPKIWALNIPVFNCNNTQMVWYRLKDSQTQPVLLTDLRYGNNIRTFCQEQCEPIDYLELSEPMWVKVDTIHNVVNTTDQARIIVSLRFQSTD